MNRPVIERDTGLCKNIVKNLRHLLLRKCYLFFFFLSIYRLLDMKNRHLSWDQGFQRVKYLDKNEFYLAFVTNRSLSRNIALWCIPFLSREKLHFYIWYFFLFFSTRDNDNVASRKWSARFFFLRERENLRKLAHPRYISTQAITCHATNA